MEQPKIFRYDTVDSTNTVCKSLAAQGAPSGTAVIARRQTAGRGRMGRSFESPEGLGLYLSVLWRPEGTPEDLLPLTPMAAVSAAGAIRRVTGAPVRIKWPNDLVLEVRAKAGIAPEDVVTCRPADLLEPELEKYRQEFRGLAKSDEDVLSLALFPQVAPKFIEKRDHQPEPVSDDAPAVWELYVDAKSIL